MRQCARIVKSYGTDGRVLVSFFGEIPEAEKFEEPVFLYFEGIPVPFFIESVETKGNGRAVVKFEDVDTLRDSDGISGLTVYAGSSYGDAGSGFDTDELAGFSLYDDGGVYRGKVVRTDNFSGNVCLTLDSGVIVPYNDELLISLDEREKTLMLTVPDGI